MTANKKVTEEIKPVIGLAPAADALAGTKTTDVVSLANYGKVAFFLHRGIGSTGTQTLTVQASAANDGASPTAIAFKYRRMSSGDTLGDWTTATSAGFTTAAGGDDVYVIEVAAADTPDEKPWVHLKSVEVVDAAVAAGVLIVLGDPRYAGEDMPTAIA